MEESELSRLRWRCRRGIKEMDILLVRFLEEVFPELDEREQLIFADLLEETDLDIYAWIMGKSSPYNSSYSNIISQLQKITEQS